MYLLLLDKMPVYSWTPPTPPRPLAFSQVSQTAHRELPNLLLIKGHCECWVFCLSWQNTRLTKCFSFKSYTLTCSPRYCRDGKWTFHSIISWNVSFWPPHTLTMTADILIKEKITSPCRATHKKLNRLYNVCWSLEWRFSEKRIQDTTPDCWSFHEDGSKLAHVGF